MEQTFEITITGWEYHTWQGRLDCGGKRIPFRSELELLLALDRLLPKFRAEIEHTEDAQDCLTQEKEVSQWKPI